MKIRNWMLTHLSVEQPLYLQKLLAQPLPLKAGFQWTHKHKKWWTWSVLVEYFDTLRHPVWRVVFFSCHFVVLYELLKNLTEYLENLSEPYKSSMGAAPSLVFCKRPSSLVLQTNWLLVLSRLFTVTAVVPSKLAIVLWFRSHPTNKKHCAGAIAKNASDSKCCTPKPPVITLQYNCWLDSSIEFPWTYWTSRPDFCNWHWISFDQNRKTWFWTSEKTSNKSFRNSLRLDIAFNLNN